MQTTPCLPCGGTQTVNVPGTPGLSAYAVVTNQFTIPSVNSNVTVSVNQTSSFLEGQNVYVGLATANGANFQVASIQSPYTITLKYLGFSGDLAAATVIPAGYLVVPGTGNIGALTSQGFTTTTANFNIATSITISVFSSAAFQIDQQVFIANATQRINGIVTAVPSSTSITITVLNFPGDSPSGTINSGALVTPGSGNNISFGTATTLASSFAIPSANSTGTATVFGFNASGAIGPKYVVIYSSTGGTLYGTFSVSASSSTSLTLKPLLLPGESQSGTLPVGSLVIPVAAPNIGFSPGIAADPTGVQLAVSGNAAPGSGYALTTNSTAQVTVNGTLIQVTLPLAGTYVIFGWANINGVGSTFPVTGSGVSNVTLVLIGSPSSFFSLATVIRPRVGASTAATTQSGTWATAMLSPVTWVTASSGTCTMIASIDVLPSAGSIEIVQATILAIKIA